MIRVLLVLLTIAGGCQTVKCPEPEPPPQGELTAAVDSLKAVITDR